MPIIFLFNFLWPGWFIEPPEPPVATPLAVHRRRLRDWHFARCRAEGGVMWHFFNADRQQRRR